MPNMRNIINEIDFDKETGIPFGEDVWGNLHALTWDCVVSNKELPRVYFQTAIRNFTWGNINNWSRIQDTYNVGKFLVYKVPENFKYHLAFILAAQARSNGGDDQGISYIGLFFNGNFAAQIPFKNETHYKLFSPIVVPSGTEIEFKFRPYHNKMDFGMTAGGYLVLQG